MHDGHGGSSVAAARMAEYDCSLNGALNGKVLMQNQGAAFDNRPCDQFVRIFHSVKHPINVDTDRPMTVKPDRHPHFVAKGAISEIPLDGRDIIINTPVPKVIPEVVLTVIAGNGREEPLVLPAVLQRGHDAAEGVHGIGFLDSFQKIDHHIIDQIILIGKMIIERLLGSAGAVKNVLHRNLA